jgi:ribonuclease P/MRP protein subunit RPP40
LKGKSCTTNLLEYLDILTDAIHNGIPVDVLYTDFKKAFDSVSIKKLLSKLLASGISGILLKWIECFLSNRKQRVVMGDCVTDWIDVLSGVPQGSVLGPILFLIFINDLPERLINDSRLYADDNKIIAPISSQSDSKVFQNDIKLLDEWSIQWKLGLCNNSTVILRVT